MRDEKGLIEGVDGVMIRPHDRGFRETAVELEQATRARNDALNAKRKADRIWRAAIVDSCNYRSARATATLAGVTHPRIHQILNETDPAERSDN